MEGINTTERKTNCKTIEAKVLYEGPSDFHNWFGYGNGVMIQQYKKSFLRRTRTKVDYISLNGDSGRLFDERFFNNSFKGFKEGLVRQELLGKKKGFDIFDIWSPDYREFCLVARLFNGRDVVIHPGPLRGYNRWDTFDDGVVVFEFDGEYSLHCKNTNQRLVSYHLDGSRKVLNVESSYDNWKTFSKGVILETSEKIGSEKMGGIEFNTYDDIYTAYTFDGRTIELFRGRRPLFFSPCPWFAFGEGIGMKEYNETHGGVTLYDIQGRKSSLFWLPKGTYNFRPFGKGVITKDESPLKQSLNLFLPKIMLRDIPNIDDGLKKKIVRAGLEELLKVEQTKLTAYWPIYENEN